MVVHGAPGTARATDWDSAQRLDLDTLLRRYDAPRLSVRAALEAMTYEDLQERGVVFFDAGFLAVFGEQWARRRIRETSVAATRSWLWSAWESHALIERLRRTQESAVEDVPPQLSGWDVSHLRALMAHGRGLMLCSFHYGAFRHIATDLAILGFDVVMAVDAKGTKEHGEAIASVPALRRLTLLDAEAPAAFERLRVVLEQGAIVLICVDGNTGQTGRGGGQHTVDFLGCTVRIKTGPARLAAAVGSPLLHCVATRGRGETGHVVLGPELWPPTGNGDPTEQGFVPDAMAALWDASAAAVRRDPVAWEGARLLNRSRVALERVHSPHASLTIEALRAHFDGGRALRVNERWVADGWLDGRACWTDVRSLSTFAFPDWASDVARALAERSGLTAQLVAAHGDLRAGQVLELLQDLIRRDVVVWSDSDPTASL